MISFQLLIKLIILKNNYKLVFISKWYYIMSHQYKYVKNIAIKYPFKFGFLRVRAEGGGGVKTANEYTLLPYCNQIVEYI